MKRTIVIAVLIVSIAVFPALAQRRAPAGPISPFAHNAQAIQQGETIYNQNCTQCHGARGTMGETGPAVVAAEGPDLFGRDGQLFGVIRNGVNGTSMLAWSGKLSDDDIWRVVSYIQALRSPAVDYPMPGDIARGEQIFWGNGQCGSCHMIGGRGGLTGPDLSNIANIRKSNSIVDALTKPLHHVYGSGGAHLEMLPPMDTYLPVRVTAADGKTVSGVLMNEDNFSLEVMGDDEHLHLFDRAKLRDVAVGTRSKMPTDYDKRLTADEFKDLLAFLTHQGRAPAAGGRGTTAGN